MTGGRLLETTRRPNGVPSELLEGVLFALPHSRTFDLEKQCAAPLGASVHGPSGLIWRECTQRNQESNDVLPLSLGGLNHRHHRAQTPRPGSCAAAKCHFPQDHQATNSLLGKVICRRHTRMVQKS